MGSRIHLTSSGLTTEIGKTPVKRQTTNGRSLLTRRQFMGAAVAGASVGLELRRSGAEISQAPHPLLVNGIRHQSNDATLVIATHRTPTDLDPHSAYDAGSRIVLQGSFETLIRVEPGNTDRYQSALATSWESDPDRRNWTFHLREEVRFQDGSACDARAVRASFERLLALARGPSTVVGRFVQDVAQISVPDARTVVFDLGQPASLFEAAVASATVSAIVNVELARQHEVDGDWGTAWAQTTTDGLGTGPYRMTRFDMAEGIAFARHNAYWGGWDDPHFDQVLVRIVGEAATRRELIERGEIDIVDSLPPGTLDELAANSDLVVDLRYNLATRYIMFNTTGTLQSPSARQAICYAFPYDDVIDGVYEGHAKRAIGPCAELCRGFARETFVYETDLPQARALLDQAGVPQGTTLTMLIPAGVPLAESIAQLFGANLAEAGLELDIQTVDFATFVSIYYGDMPADERPNLMPGFWEPDYDDGWNHLWPQVSSAAWNVGNAGHYANPQVDELLNDARDAEDEATYNRALAEIQQIVTRDDPAAVYYAQEQWPTILRTSVGGFVPNLVSAELYDFYALHRQRQ